MTILTKDEIRDRLRARMFMSGIVRDTARLHNAQEMFTPTPLVMTLLDRLDQGLFKDPTKTFCDPTCGDGQFLGEVLIRKMEHGSSFEQALSTIYGVDIMPDNVKACQDHLLCGEEQFRKIVEQNIIWADVLDYDLQFGAGEYRAGGLIIIEGQVGANVPQPKKRKVKRMGVMPGIFE
jgi:hypothetical protein